ncbi:MAG: anthranilate synthase component I [Lachnospiraceae bacterium]|nr:anthranilate synthase component I [Lachnospiraceae bacterium]
MRMEIGELRKMKEEGIYRVAPVSIEMLSDMRTPVQVLRILRNVSEKVFLLESVENHKNSGRYTFLGYEPKSVISCMNGSVIADGKTIGTDPVRYLRDVLDAYKSPRIRELPPFTGGLVGFFSYDFIKYSELTLNLHDEDREGFPDLELMLFDKVIAFDHFRQKIVLIANVMLDDPDKGCEQAMKELNDLADLIKNGEMKEEIPGEATGEFIPDLSEEEFGDMILKAKHHIREGDIFQIVLSNRLSAPFRGSLLNTYRMLRTINPSPYMFYIQNGEREIAGASPETLVKLKDGILHTYPLAGSRRRGESEEEDEALEKELLKDEKELAEHNMLVDLGRNDLGKISEFGTVEVDKLRCVERYSHVMHIASSVKGKIRDNEDSLSAISAVLPAGTLSGAPKIRACELIDELEGNRRGIYGGAIGYLDFAGDMDTCIAIRIAYKDRGTVYARSGAGIVADSDPVSEYKETLNKANAVVDAIRRSKEVEA